MFSLHGARQWELQRTFSWGVNHLLRVETYIEEKFRKTQHNTGCNHLCHRKPGFSPSHKIRGIHSDIDRLPSELDPYEQFSILH